MEKFTEAELSFMAQFFINEVGYPETDSVVKSVIDKFEKMELPGFNLSWKVSDYGTIVFTTYDEE